MVDSCKEQSFVAQAGTSSRKRHFQQKCHFMSRIYPILHVITNFYAGKRNGFQIVLICTEVTVTLSFTCCILRQLLSSIERPVGHCALLSRILRVSDQEKKLLLERPNKILADIIINGNNYLSS